MSQSNDTPKAPRGGRASGKPGVGSRVGLEMTDERQDDERDGLEREFSEDPDFAEDERLELFLETQHQTVLPNLPIMDGYHVCWLTTSNPRDSIQWRQSIGYELLLAEHCPQWKGVSANVGGVYGCVSVNEMVAARISISLYNKLMKAVGHYLPLQEEQKLRSQTDSLAQRARQRNLEVQEGDGTAGIVQRAERPIPVFTE